MELKKLDNRPPVVVHDEPAPKAKAVAGAAKPEKVYSKPPLADGDPNPRNFVEAPVSDAKRTTISADPVPEAFFAGRHPVSDKERNSPACLAATDSARANLSLALLRGGDRVVATVDCVDIYHPRETIELQAGAVVPDGKVYIPRNLVHADAFAK